MKDAKIKNLFGLVLTGGKSSRMKRDKAVIQYHGVAQSIYCYNLLKNFCENVYISNRKEQSEIDGQKGLPQIHDKASYADIGPLGGILSAMAAYPDADWLVLGCDLPFVNSKTIKELIKKRNKSKLATVYQSVYDDLPEPLCAIYERRIVYQFKEKLEEKIVCPRKILLSSDVEILPLTNRNDLDNINTPEEYQKVMQTRSKI